MKKQFLLLVSLFTLSFANISFAQYQINGNASALGGGCYQLTPDATTQVGSVWNTTLIDLTTPFDFTFSVNLGCNDGGADGICFGLQPLNTNIGINGNGMGLGGVSPSVGIYIDTYQNTLPDNDPFADHISINANGDVNHLSANNLAGPVDASATSIDVEDCVNHILRIKWDPVTQTMQVWFDGNLRLTYVGDIINNIFGGNPNVFWGFTGATGGLSNAQSFCVVFNANFSTNTICIGGVTTFTDLSVTTSGNLITNWAWDFGDGSPLFSGGVAATYQNPTHTYLTSGTFNATLTITVTNLQTTTVTIPVIVLAPPTVTAAGGMTICVGQSATLTGTVGGPSNIPQTFTSSGINNGVFVTQGVPFGWTGTGSIFSTSDIPVSGLNSGWTLGSITLDISHSFDGDVIAYLFDPCGNSIQLISGNGGAGDNFTNTTFTPTASTNISTGTPPFSGTFIPSGGAAAWAAFIAASQGCAGANGTWSLHVGDDAAGDDGNINTWSITFINPSPPTYVWSPTVNMTNSTTLTPTVTPAATTTYTLTATNSFGCSDTAMTTVTIAPSLFITVTPPTDIICVGETDTLRANGATSYVWSAGATSIGVDSASVSPIVTTTYTVTGTSGTCTGDTTITITVNPGLNIGVNNPSVCIGQSATLNATGGTTYTWSAGATSSGPTSAIVTTPPLGTSTYTVTGTTGICSGTNTATVTVNPLPTITLTTVPICTGQTATLTAGGAATYTWSAGATSSGVNTATASPMVNTTYTVTGTDVNSCVNTDTVTVIVGTSVTVTAVGDVICAGAVAHLSASGGATSYSWSAGAVSTGINTADASPMTTTTYTVTGTNGSCSGTALATVLVNALPVAAFSAPVSSSILNPLVSFHDNSVNAASWTWNFGDFGNPGTNTSNASNPNHKYSAVGNYCVKLVVENNTCKDSVTNCIDIAQEFIFYIPNAFSPNDDGINDDFFGTGENIKTYEMSIYNRWGELVFWTDDRAKHWNGNMKKDGEINSSDVFVYVFNVTDNHNENHKYIGKVTLVK